MHSSNPGSSSISSDQASSPVDVSQQTLQQPSLAAAGSPTRQRKQRRSQQAWDYKYKWNPCPSPCEANDDRCRKVEALIQNVLSYPIMPIHICKYLPRSSADLNSMTALVEQMASHFGKELTLVYITKTPRILELNFSTVLERIKAFRELFGVLDSDVPMMLRKYSGLVTLEPQEVRLRLDNLRELTGFNNQQMRAFVLKFPLGISYPPGLVRMWIERFRQLCFTRDEWTRTLQLEMTPSLMAFFLKDAGDQLLRLEYLASTGERPEWQLRTVMKPSDRTFRAKTKNFAMWEQRVKARRAQQRVAVKAARLQQQQQAEAAEIKAALLAEDEGQQQGTAAGPVQQQQWQQQWPQQLDQQQQLGQPGLQPQGPAAQVMQQQQGQPSP